VTRCDLPAFHFRPVRHDALPPESGRKLIGLLIDNALFELPQKLQAFFRVCGSALLVVEVLLHQQRLSYKRETNTLFLI